MELGVTERQVSVVTRAELQRQGQALAENVKRALIAATNAGMQPHEALLALVSATAKASYDAGFTREFFFQFAGAIYDQLKRKVEAGQVQVLRGWVAGKDGAGNGL